MVFWAQRVFAYQLISDGEYSYDGENEAKVKSLPINQLEDLGEALLDFDSLQDLISWLDNH